VARYLLRISMPDRPGALGLVASRIGAVGGDIIAIDILDRVDDRVIDEFAVDIHSEDHVELLRNEIHEVDGAQVTDIQEITAKRRDPST
jgi:ACT domain-containing protein